VRTTTDLLILRWRVAQWFLALVDGNDEQAGALVQAMGIEGITRPDIVDEFTLLRAQFGHRKRYHLVSEINRLWDKIRERCTRCDRPGRYRDTNGICYRCITEEPS
jgi:hypothetical protein